MSLRLSEILPDGEKGGDDLRRAQNQVLTITLVPNGRPPDSPNLTTGPTLQAFVSPSATFPSSSTLARQSVVPSDSLQLSPYSFTPFHASLHPPSLPNERSCYHVDWSPPVGGDSEQIPVPPSRDWASIFGGSAVQGVLHLNFDSWPDDKQPAPEAERSDESGTAG